MWEELNLDIKLCDECNVSNTNKAPLLGEGNKNGRIVILFDHITKEMIECNSIFRNSSGDYLKNVLEYSGIDMNECYFTSITKYFNDGIVNDEERRYNMPILLKELCLVNPEYIIVIGEDAFNFLYKYYTKDLRENVLVINIKNNVGKIFDFYTTKLIPMYDINFIFGLSKQEKRKIVNILKETKK